MNEKEKSDSKQEKNRSYQEKFKKNIAISNNEHLKKFNAKTYKRFCLKCYKEFIGKGFYNRLCNTCVYENKKLKFVR